MLHLCILLDDFVVGSLILFCVMSLGTCTQTLHVLYVLRFSYDVVCIHAFFFKNSLLVVFRSFDLLLLTLVIFSSLLLFVCFCCSCTRVSTCLPLFSTVLLRLLCTLILALIWYSYFAQTLRVPC